ncbi:hypothetical protein N7533_002505 [Penicillium manginii]|uniref:uncharacterized protein n=1 Tax=Penicillium manginii TaxID=203109 RepID=UPI00254974EC|nr:uncharacterized protein N7533_002505 [Penicillium manginii]KAJ5763824.1 hypothetical protein N7533_002505 [Penicillium manginii]
MPTRTCSTSAFPDISTFLEFLFSSSPRHGDDDIEPTDYFSPRDALDATPSGSKTPPRTSYFSSVSVPSTPPILSHSRSTSRTRHHNRSKSSSRATTFSDSNLQSHTRDISLPLHHQGHHQHKKTSSSPHLRRHQSEYAHNHTHAQSHTPKSDAEWMLRAGIALASSTREEKGQSWLSKRESSTSLVAEIPIDNESAHHRHHRRTKSGSSRKSRPGSGASTPAGGMSLSRRSSRNRGMSRRGSRAGLTMTSMPLTATTTTTTASTSSMVAAGPAGAVALGKMSSPAGAITPETRGRSSAEQSRSGLEADFVDERIRAEMASLQRQGLDRDESGGGNGDDYYGEGFEGDEEYWDGDEYGDDGSEYDYSTDETPDEFDEADLQRLTRERGFGLGGWIDRLVEWTLFGVEEWPASGSSTATRIGTAATTTTVTFEEALPGSGTEQDEGHDNLSLDSMELDRYSDIDTVSHAEGDSVVVEKPGERGGWEDAGWLFRVVKRAII